MEFTLGESIMLPVLFLALLPAVEPVAPVYPDHSKLLIVRDAEGKEVPVKSPDDWKKRRAHIVANMELVMGPLPPIEKKVPLDPQMIEEVKTDKFIRRKITIAVEKGDRLPMYLFLPLNLKGKTPAVLCLHPTSRPLGKGVPAGFGDKYDRHYAVHLAERGYITLAPDYVNMGEYKFDAYSNGYASATMKAIWNHMRSVDYLQSLDTVDGANIAVIGHSLGGHNSIFLGVFDDRVKCIVSNCGFCSFPRYMKGDLKGWSHDGYMPRIQKVYNSDPAKMPFDFTEAVAALAPRAFLASAPEKDDNFDLQGVKDCIIAAEPVYELLGVKQKIKGYYPMGGHDFPDDARDVAYRFIDLHLKGK